MAAVFKTKTNLKQNKINLSLAQFSENQEVDNKNHNKIEYIHLLQRLNQKRPVALREIFGPK